MNLEVRRLLNLDTTQTHGEPINGLDVPTLLTEVINNPFRPGHLFAQQEGLYANINDKRAIGIIQRQNGNITTTKIKGIPIELIDTNIALKRLKIGEIPMWLNSEYANIEFANAESLNSLTNENLYQKPLGVFSLDCLNGQSSNVFIPEYLAQNFDPALSLIIAINAIDTNVSTYVSKINGYDIRTNQGPSHLAFSNPDLDVFSYSPYANGKSRDTFFLLDQATKNILGTVGGYNAGDILLNSDISLDEIVRQTYTRLAESYNTSIALPEGEITFDNYLNTLIEIMSQEESAYFIVRRFIENNIKAITTAHNSGWTFSSGYGMGSSTTSRNVSWGTANSGSLNDFPTVRHHENRDENFKNFATKDMYEFLGSVAGMTRLFVFVDWRDTLDFIKETYASHIIKESMVDLNQDKINRLASFLSLTNN